MIGILGFGFYFQDHSYIKRSRMNIVNVIVIILIVVSKAEFMDKMISKIIGRFVIIKIFTLFDRTSKETSISLNAMSAIAERFLRVLFVYVFLLLIPAILPLKLQRNAFYYCENSYPFNDSIPTSR